MTDQYVAEIRIFPFTITPTGWAQCNGQLLPISQNTALFSLLGTMYGGDGQSTFALPDLRGNATMHPGQGPGLSQHLLGESAGSETVTLLESEIPAHSHAELANAAAADLQGPGPARVLARASGGSAYQTNSATDIVAMSDQALSPAGGDQPHNNMQPYLTFHFCIALQGIFPPHS